MTPRPHSSRVLTPWLLAGPGAVFFAGMILLPLALTVILSFRAYDHATGIKDTYTLAHYIAVVTDGCRARASSTPACRVCGDRRSTGLAGASVPGSTPITCR